MVVCYFAVVMTHVTAAVAAHYSVYALITVIPTMLRLQTRALSIW